MKRQYFFLLILSLLSIPTRAAQIASDNHSSRSARSNESQISYQDQTGGARMVALDELVLGPKKCPSDLNLISVNDGYSVDKKNPFVFFEMRNGQKRWVASKTINGSDVKEIVKHIQSLNYHQSIHINTGGHGDPSGKTVYNNCDYAEVSFIVEDFHLVRSLTNVSLHIMSSMSDAIYPKKANHIIDAWCFSKKTMERKRKRKEILIDSGMALGSGLLLSSTGMSIAFLASGAASTTYVAAQSGAVVGGTFGGPVGLALGAVTGGIIGVTLSIINLHFLHKRRKRALLQ